MRRAVTVAAIALAGTAAPAQAHVDVLPPTVTAGTATELIVRVPTERDVPTTRVEVDVPDEVTVYSLGEPPGDWRVTATTGPDGRIARVTWSGGTVAPGRHHDFTMLGTPFTPGEATWTTRQTYADGQVKPWTGPREDEGEARGESGPGDPGPASFMTIAEEGPDGAGAGPGAEDPDEGSGAAVWLGVIAIGIAALAAIGTGLLWSSRPATLPADDDSGEGGGG